MNCNDDLLTIENIRKSFPGVVAVDGVSFSIKKGEVHIIVGENGAGKSTLVKIFAGINDLDEGSMILEGNVYKPISVKDAQDHGINMIYQELNLMPNLTVAQNVFIGREPVKHKMLNTIDVSKMNEACKQLLNELEIDIDPDEIVSKLSIAQQQMVEVAKALSKQSKLLIMDEPTSSLTDQEIDNLFRITRKLRGEGVSIIYISHRMKELWEIGDRVTIMRDGKYIGTYPIDQISLDDVVTKMVGRKISNVFNRTYLEPKEELLRVRNLTGLRFRNINISVRAGEVVGLAGLIGAGRTEFAKAVFGFDKIESGDVWINGEHVKNSRWNPRKAIARGLSFLPEDRKTEGLFVKKTIQENVIQASLDKLFKFGIIDHKKASSITSGYIKELRIATPSEQKIVNELSGGNQQKVVLAKWLCTNPKIFILDEPTRGIDIGAKAEIYELINSLVEQGAGVLLITSEQMEMVGLADRVYVLKDGEIADMLDRRANDITQEHIVSLALGRNINV